MTIGGAGTDMNEPRDILFFLSNDWKDLWAAQQKIAVELSRQHRVLAFETLGFSERKVEKADLKRITSRLAGFFRGEWKALDQLIVCPAPLFPVSEKSFLGRVGHWGVKRFVQKKMKRYRLKDVLFWTFLPSRRILNLIDTLKPAGVVYECLDDFSRYEGAPADFSEIETALVKRADVVFVSSRKQEALKKKINPATYLVHNASDVEHFRKARDQETRLPEAFRKKQGSAVGFIGAFDFWVDTDLIKKLAKALPEVEIMMIGPNERLKADQMPRLRNLHWIGRVPYQTLPSYLKLLDVALLPYRKNTYMETADPIVMYDYLAAGKRVVATDFPAAYDVPPSLIRIAKTDDEFIRQVREEIIFLLNEEKTRIRSEECLDFARGNTWQKRVATQWQVIEKHTKEK